MTRVRFIAAVLAVLALALALRLVWLEADPPITEQVGIVWHDEGAWVHNARNRALWGVWRTDEWNPVFIAPVFTGLEYLAFSVFGVGTWQARTVPALSGLATVIFMMAGLRALRGRRAALIGGTLLATNYAFVMWNRAALMESTMTAAMVGAWATYALAGRRPAWSAATGVLAVIAWFTKAAAAFFIAAVALDALLSLRSPATRRSGLLTLSAMTASAALIGALFVWPYWEEYAFYNWQMTVTRKPEYSLDALIDRGTWLPIVHGLFTQMWPVLLAGLIGLWAVIVRWREAQPAERLLVFWMLIGLAELVVHDSGNARRYVMFIPALIALTGLLAGPARPAAPMVPEPMNWRRLVAAFVFMAPLAYLLWGSALRPLFLDEIDAGDLRMTVRVSAALALVVSAVLAARLPQLHVRLARVSLPPVVVGLLVAGMVTWHLMAYGSWAAGRTSMNQAASVAVGELLAEGTEVQGKLANGLALENRIRPLFVGNGFGNYEDRLERDDVAYILTYDLPRIGYESQDGSGLIQQILQHYPDRQLVETFPVEETAGVERAALFRKFPAPVPADARD